MSTTITGAELRRRIDDQGRELAILDLRSPLERTTGHLSVSSGVPLHDLEQRVRTAVPRLDTPVVLASGRALDDRGATILASLGYTDVSVLEDGLDSWTSAGERLYTGTNVRSKTLGEWIEGEFGTSTVDSATVAEWRARGEDVVVLDSRPHGEYVHHHIPGGYDTGGGAELAFRGLQAVPGPQTKIVVNCAGRTRGIVGAQSLVNTGIVNPVYSLHNGTPAWGWAGLPIESGEGQPLDVPTEIPDDLRKWAQQTLESAAVEVIGADELVRLRGDESATTYVIDVRRPEEYAAGHVAGSLSVQGGQLVQGSDEHLAVRRAHVVLVDTEDLLRSASTVQWLRYLHDGPVSVIVHEQELESSAGASVDEVPVPAVATVSGEQLASWLDAGEDLQVVDLRSSAAYRAGHVPGSVHARREHLLALVRDQGAARTVLVGDASYAPHFAADELLRDHGVGAVVLDGGIDALPVALTTADPSYAGAVVDQVGPPEFGPERDRWYEEYFEWEYSLVPSSTGDPDFDFEGKKP
jgi:rhodanese-related sulfurtransferase